MELIDLLIEEELDWDLVWWAGAGHEDEEDEEYEEYRF